MQLRQDENASVNLRMTSLIDIIFILLLFFIVTSVIMKQAGGRLGERAYLKVQNVFAESEQVNAFLTVFIFSIGYFVFARWLKLSYHDAAPAALIGASNHFEVAIATAVILFGLSSGAALATVVGVLIEAVKELTEEVNTLKSQLNK